MKKRQIEIKKEISKFKNDVKKNIDIEYCYLCNKKINGTCNSHNVPQSYLKNISKNGKLDYGLSFFSSLDLGSSGINNAHTFRLICNECDSKFFSLYENNENIINYDNKTNEEKNKMLIQIAIKSRLSYIYMYKFDQEAATQFVGKQMESINRELMPDKKTNREFVVEMNEKYINDLKKAIKKNKFHFEVIYNKLFDYKINIATQCLISYIYDLNGKQLFNIHDRNSFQYARDFYFVILPCKDKTRVMVYIEKKYLNEENVQSIISQFNNLSEEEKLQFIFMSLIVYNEQIYINPDLFEVMKQDKKLRKAYIRTQISPLDSWNVLKNYKRYTNYLLKDYNKE